jgi:hypothetical protein
MVEDGEVDIVAVKREYSNLTTKDSVLARSRSSLKLNIFDVLNLANNPNGVTHFHGTHGGRCLEGIILTTTTIVTYTIIYIYTCFFFSIDGPLPSNTMNNKEKKVWID